MRTGTDDDRAVGDQARYAWRVLSVTSLGVLLSGTNTSTLDVALPVVARHFSADATAASWIVLSFMLVNTALILVFGRVADIVGRRRLYMTGLAILTGASVLCGFAPSALVLAICRALQAVGAAAIITNTGLRQHHADGDRPVRGRAPDRAVPAGGLGGRPVPGRGAGDPGGGRHGAGRHDLTVAGLPGHRRLPAGRRHRHRDLHDPQHQLDHDRGRARPPRHRQRRPVDAAEHRLRGQHGDVAGHRDQPADPGREAGRLRGHLVAAVAAGPGQLHRRLPDRAGGAGRRLRARHGAVARPQPQAT
ncbi:MAG: MFS transporter [Actinobacteria bacterium]|nr:MFS transporter [Actinomycetota bacterium]